MNSDYESFIKSNLGKPVEVEDPSNRDQCMDWAFAYVDFLNIPREAIRHLNAYQIWTEATDETRKYFDLIPNTPDAIPQKGDLVIFGTIVGVAGHVCIADGNGDTNTFQSTDQNWNGHKYVEYVWHNYNGCLGWLRPHNQPQATVAVAADTFTHMREKLDRYDPIDAAGYHTLTDIDKKVGDLSNELKTEQEEVVQLNSSLETLSNSKKDYASQIIDAQAKANAAVALLNAHYKQFNVLTEDEYQAAVKALQAPNNAHVKEVQKIIEPLADAAILKRTPAKQKASIIRSFLNWLNN